MASSIQACLPWPDWKRPSRDLGGWMGFHVTVWSHRSAWVQGWMVSAVIHAVLVAAVVMGISAPQIIEMREAFRWEVSLVTASMETPSHQDAPAPSASSRSTTATHARPHTTAVQQEADRVVTRQVTVIRSVNTRPVQDPSIPTQFSEAPREQAVRRSEPVPVDRRVVEERKPVEQVRHEAARREDVVVTEDLPARTIAEAPSETVAEPVESHAMPVERAPEVLSPSPRLYATTSPAHAELSGEATSSDTGGTASLQATGRSDSDTSKAAAMSPADRADAVAVLPHASGVSSVRPSTMPVSQGHKPAGSPERGTATRSDYGWLARAIRVRIEEVKRYSAEARVNEWEGEVVLVASVRADGHIVEVRIAESSGNLTLDDDARAMLARASPLVLPQALGQSTVIVKIPIIFGLR